MSWRAETTGGTFETPTFPALLDLARQSLAGSGESYLVGGAVRDAYLHRPVSDLDFVIAGDGLEAGRQVAHRLGAAFFPLDPERRVGRVLVEVEGRRQTLDFASLRGSLHDDLTARDFTINAIAIPLHGPAAPIDPLSGLDDLRASRLRACSPTALRDDPVRTLRAVRLAVHLSLHIHPETREAVRQAASALPQVSAERIRDEFMRILGGPKVAGSVRILQALGLLALVLPETAGLERVAQPPPHVHDVWNHTLLLVDRLEALLDALAPRADEETAADLIMGSVSLRLGRYRQSIEALLSRTLAGDRPVRGLAFLAALLHDAGKPEARQAGAEGEIRFLGHEAIGAEYAARRATALHLANQEAERIGCIVRHHMRPLLLARERSLTRRAVYRFFAATGECGVEVCLLSLADMLAIFGPTLDPQAWSTMVDTARTLLEGWYEHRAEQVDPPPLLTGEEVMQALGLRPGPQVGVMLEALREAQAAGEVGSREAALAFLRDPLPKS